jgi:hypothetical protein
MVWLWDQKLANVENYYAPTDEDPEELELQEDLVKEIIEMRLLA